MSALVNINKHLKEFEEIEKKKREEKLNSDSQTESSSYPAPFFDDSIEDNEDDELDKEFTKVDVIKNYAVPVFNIVEPNLSVKGALTKHRNKFSKILTFIDCVEHRRSRKGCSILSLSCTSKTFHNIWGSDQSVSVAFQYMKEIGLLETECNDYQYNGYTDFFNKCKSYRYYFEIEDKIIEYCKANSIPKFIIKNFKKQDPIKIKELQQQCFEDKEKPLDPKKVRFGTGLVLYRPKNVGVESFKDTLKSILMTNYPEFERIIKLADFINKKFYINETKLAVAIEPTFHWNKETHRKDGSLITKARTYIKGIGIRATNAYCNASKSDTSNNKRKRIKRSEVIDKYGFIFEKDITSSVPRLTYALNGGGWAKESVDFYKLIYKEYDPLAIFKDDPEAASAPANCHIVGDDERQAVKDLFFRTYFDGTKAELSNHLWQKMTHDGLDEKAIKEEICKLRDAMEKVLGNKRHGNEIFYAESCIYMNVLKDLLDKGYFVWQVYDCFYGKGPGTQEDFEKFVEESVFLNFMKYKMANDFDCHDVIYEDDDKLII